MWACMLEKDAIYANLEATEDDYMHAADLEARFAEYGGYTAEARAGELLLGVGIPAEQHFGPMSDVAPGWKLRVLLIQALFADPEILLLDEPTNNLDIATIRWLENAINERNSTMVIISHDRHFLNQVCTHMADLDYGKIAVYPGNYDDFMEASTQARERQQSANAKAKERIAELQNFVRRFSANASKAKQATSRLKLIDKLKPEDVKPRLASIHGSVSSSTRRKSCIARRSKSRTSASAITAASRKSSASSTCRSTAATVWR
jgi:ATPase subunit of ABC transporter with duplicated ATPase domains